MSDCRRFAPPVAVAAALARRARSRQGKIVQTEAPAPEYLRCSRCRRSRRLLSTCRRRGMTCMQLAAASKLRGSRSNWAMFASCTQGAGAGRGASGAHSQLVQTEAQTHAEYFPAERGVQVPPSTGPQFSLASAGYTSTPGCPYHSLCTRSRPKTIHISKRYESGSGGCRRWLRAAC